jgi:NADH:ubiquinone oxidoreductase subunit E
VVVTESKPTPPTTIMVCVNRRFRADEASCAKRGSEALAEALEAGIRERRIAIKLERSICMGHCQTGPTVRLAPGGRFFHGPALTQVTEILDELESLCGHLEAAASEPPAHLLGS